MKTIEFCTELTWVLGMETAVGGRKMCSRTPYLQIIIIIIILIIMIIITIIVILTCRLGAPPLSWWGRRREPLVRTLIQSSSLASSLASSLSSSLSSRSLYSPAASHPREADIWGTNFATFGTFWVWRQVSFSEKYKYRNERVIKRMFVTNSLFLENLF